MSERIVNEGRLRGPVSILVDRVAKYGFLEPGSTHYTDAIDQECAALLAKFPESSRPAPARDAPEPAAAREAITTAIGWLNREYPDPGTVGQGQAWATIAVAEALIAGLPSRPSSATPEVE